MSIQISANGLPVSTALTSSTAPLPWPMIRRCIPKWKPIWSPDGTRIAFTSYQEGAYALIVMDADGGHRITLADGLLGPAWVGGGVRFGPAIGLS